MAGYSVNRIPETQKTFLSSVPNLWTSDGVLAVQPNISQYFGEGSLEVVLQEMETVYYNSDGTNGLSQLTQATSLDTEDSVSAFVWVKTNNPVVINFTVSVLFPVGIVSATAASSQSRSISVTSGEWALLRLHDLPVIPDDAYNYPLGFSIQIEDIEGSTDVTLNISHPIIYCTLDFIDNPSIINIMSRLPEFIRDQDASAAPIPYQLIRFIEAASTHTGEIQDLLSSFIYADISEGKDESNTETLSQLVDPIAARRAYLPWLAQFSGTQIINPTTGFTPWANLPETWEGIDLLDADEPPLDEAVSWEVLQNFDTEPAGLEQFLRWQASTGYYGVNSGTKQAIIDAVKRVLTGTKTVGYEVISPFDWTIKIETQQSETPDSALLSIGDTVLEILELVEPTRPLGFKVIHELV